MVFTGSATMVVTAIDCLVPFPAVFEAFAEVAFLTAASYLGSVEAVAFKPYGYPFYSVNISQSWSGPWVDTAEIGLVFFVVMERLDVEEFFALVALDLVALVAEAKLVDF